MKGKTLKFIALACLLMPMAALSAKSESADRPTEHVKGFLWLEAEHFDTFGDWKLDTQFTHKMGSAYLICPGLDTPKSKVASTKILIPRAGTWHAWVRTKDWLPEFSPGKFALEIDGHRSGTLGASGKGGWRWEKALDCELAAGEVRISLVDLSGAFARCDAVLLTEDSAYVPPDDEKRLLDERLRLSGVSDRVAEGGTFDFIVVGAGPGGMGAAVSAARTGARVGLVYDRPVPGGNGSREMGIGLDGAALSRKGSREAGLAEEIRLRALQTDVHGRGSLGRAYEMLLDEMKDSIAAFPNERVMRVEKEGRRIVAVIARNTLTGKWTRYRAKLFADATGDGWIAYFAGARTMYGREDRSTFNEAWTVEKADKLTMSGSLMGGCVGLRVKKLPEGQVRAPYHAPVWARVLPRPFWRPQNSPGSNWWLENPGRIDDLEDPEGARDNLIRISFDYWDWQCNEWEMKSLTEGYVLDYVPFHNARREGMRVVGDYILTGNDCVNETVFPDAVATGGWGCDVHDPLGMENPKSDGWNCEHSGGPGPYTVPYRMLYSADIDNLFLSSRCFSMSHVALGSMRVCGTIMSAAQAVGTAAALCLKRGLMPREYGQRHLDELRHRLFRDDQNIQWLADDDPENLALKAKASDPGLNDGVGVPQWPCTWKGRKYPGNYHGWQSEEKVATLEWEKSVRATEIRIAFDTGLKPRRVEAPVPRELVRDYTLEVRANGKWREIARVRENRQRHRIHSFDETEIDSVRVTVERTWGDRLSRILELRVYPAAVPSVKSENCPLTKRVVQPASKRDSNLPREQGLYRCQIHRGGGRFVCPENALETCLWCWRHGMSPEADARLTKDGVAIALHDDNLKRVGSGITPELASRKISDLTWAEIRDVDIGSYLKKNFSSTRIPTMESIFAAMKGRPERLLYVDEKRVPPELIAELAERFGVIEQVYYCSKDWRIVRNWRKIAPKGRSMVWLGAWAKTNSPPEIVRCEKYVQKQLDEMAATSFEGIDQVQLHVRIDFSQSDPFCPSTSFLKRAIDQMHRYGVTVNVFSLTEGTNPDAYWRLWNLGFDHFTTNFPLTLFKVVDEIKSGVKK